MAAREITNLRSGSAGTVDAPAENYAHPPFDRDHIVFAWGFLTCPNDILVPHQKSIFDFSYARVMLVQFAD